MKILKSIKEIHYINVLIVLLIISSAMVITATATRQKENIKQELAATLKELDNSVDSGLNAIDYLSNAMAEHYNERHKLELNYALKVKPVDDRGDYALDIQNIANITAFDVTKLNQEILAEMESSMKLMNFMKIVHEKNEKYAWIYFISKNYSF